MLRVVTIVATLTLFFFVFLIFNKIVLDISTKIILLFFNKKEVDGIFKLLRLLILEMLLKVFKFCVTQLNV